MASVSRSYVPVKVDYSDLYDIMTFFRGTPDGKGAHDELGKKIGLAGKHWARDHWRKQDMAAYMCTLSLAARPVVSSADPAFSAVRLILEWGRLLHRGEDDGMSPDFEFDAD